MSGLETLPPDQRAVLHLILQQGRGYADLAGMLKIDAGAVRERAHAGLDALGGPSGDGLAPEQRARIADYLLGQQDVAERLVTFAELGDAADACRWAQHVRERLAPLAQEALPEVPALASANGRAATTVPESVAPAASLASSAEPAPATAAPAASAASAFKAAPPPPIPPAPVRADAGSPPPRRPSRTGGALLIGGVLVAVVVLAIVLLTSGGGEKKSNTATRSALPTTAARTATTTTPATATPQATVVAQVNLTAPSGSGTGSGVGLGIVERGQGGKQAIAIAAQKLAPNGKQDVYAAWLQGPPGPHFLGFVPTRVDKTGTFTASAPLPANAKSYTSVLITRESTKRVPKTPGPTILSGTLSIP
jgi:hypothetical protein